MDDSSLVGQSEDSEEIVVLRREFVRRRHQRQKYRCRCGARIHSAKRPLKLEEENLCSIAFDVHVATAKYDQHQPLERPERILLRSGPRRREAAQRSRPRSDAHKILRNR